MWLVPRSCLLLQLRNLAPNPCSVSPLRIACMETAEAVDVIGLPETIPFDVFGSTRVTVQVDRGNHLLPDSLRTQHNGCGERNQRYSTHRLNTPENTKGTTSFALDACYTSSKAEHLEKLILRTIVPLLLRCQQNEWVHVCCRRTGELYGGFAVSVQARVTPGCARSLVPARRRCDSPSGQ